MRYAFYQSFNEDGNIFKLFIETQHGGVRCFKFFTDIRAVSDIPGLTRLFGEEIFDLAGNYFLFPVDYQNVETGNFVFSGDGDKFTKLSFIDDDKTLKGDWVLRWLSNGTILFWKPFPVISMIPTNTVTVTLAKGEHLVPVEQQFSVFQVDSAGYEFEGILAAEGIWTDNKWRTVLFTKDIIKSIYQQFSAALDSKVVDFNHSLLKAGHFTGVELHEENGVAHISVKGVADKPVPFGSGLSLWTKSKIKWDDNLNVDVLLETEPLGGSIMTDSNPACTICMIR